MRNKKILISGLAGLLILGIGLGLHLTFRAQRTAEVPQIKEEPALREPLALPKDLPLEEAKIEKPIKPEPEKISQPIIEETKEPGYLAHLKEAGIEIEEFKNLPSMGKVVTKHMEKLGYPAVKAEFPEKLAEDHIPGKLVVKRIIYKEDNTYEFKYDQLKTNPRDTLRVITLLKYEPEVIAARPPTKIDVRAQEVATQVVAQVVLDPDFSRQWGLSKIKADQAWDIEKGKETVKIAIIDTGADLNHPDLKDNIDAGLSYDVVNDDNEPQDDSAYSHGTHVAGIIGEEGGNGIGGMGMMWQAKLLIYKALEHQENGTDGQTDEAILADAISMALEDGAKIINMSWGDTRDLRFDSQGNPTNLKDVLEAAFASDALLVAAAGNKGVLLYPCKYDEVLCVAGTDQTDSRWTQPGYESAYGEKVDVAAPAKDIYSTILDDIYGNLSGTSMAAPFVSGLAGLLLSKDANLSKERLIQIIKEKTDQVTPEPNKPIGGRINALLALQELTPPPPGNQPVARINAQPTSGNPPLEVQFDGRDSRDPNGQIVEYRWDFGDGTVTNTVGDHPKHTYNNRSSYTATLTVKDNEGLEGRASLVISVGIVTGNTSMKGKVIDSQSRDGVVDAIVEARQVSIQSASAEPGYLTRTNALGEFSLSFDLSADERIDFVLEVSHPIYNTKKQTVNGLRQGESRNIEISLTRLTPIKEGDIPVAVIDRAEPNPVFAGKPIMFSGHGEYKSLGINDYKKGDWDSMGKFLKETFGSKKQEKPEIVGCSWYSDKDGFLSAYKSFSTDKLSPGTHQIVFKVKNAQEVWSEPTTIPVLVIDESELTPDKVWIFGRATLGPEESAAGLKVYVTTHPPPEPPVPPDFFPKPFPNGIYPEANPPRSREDEIKLLQCVDVERLKELSNKIQYAEVIYKEYSEKYSKWLKEIENIQPRWEADVDGQGFFKIGIRYFGEFLFVFSPGYGAGGGYDAFNTEKSTIQRPTIPTGSYRIVDLSFGNKHLVNLKLGKIKHPHPVTKEMREELEKLQDALIKQENDPELNAYCSGDITTFPPN